MKPLTSVWEKARKKIVESEQTDHILHSVLEEFFYEQLGLKTLGLIKECRLVKGKLILRLTNKALAQELAWRKAELLLVLNNKQLVVTELVVGWRGGCWSRPVRPFPNY